MFDSYIIDNLPLESELSLLQSYGNNVDITVLRHIAGAFADLRGLHEARDLKYPFSAREAVSVVQHVQEFPADGVVAAVENILGFEGLSPVTRAQVARIFQSNDIPVPEKAPRGSQTDGGEVKLSLASPLADAHILKVSRDTSGEKSVSTTLDVTVVPFKSTDWQSSTQSEQPLRLQSSRMDNFSEEYASFWVGLEEDKHSGIRRMSGVTSEGNNLHILTTYPLELHSYLGVDNLYSSSSSDIPDTLDTSCLVQIWAGDWVTFPQPSYLIKGGVAIVLPELSMVLKLPSKTKAGRVVLRTCARYRSWGHFRHQWCVRNSGVSPSPFAAMFRGTGREQTTSADRHSLLRAHIILCRRLPMIRLPFTLPRPCGREGEYLCAA